MVTICRDIARRRTEPAGPVLLDGVHLVSEALALGLRLRHVAFTARARASDEGARLAAALAGHGPSIVDVTDSVMEAMSPVSSPSGVIAIADRPTSSLAHALDHPPQLVVAVVDVQEPGNVGAVVRAAEACWATGVVCCGASADAFGPKALRGSMGSALRLPVVSGVPAVDAIAAMKARGLRLVATVPAGGVRPDALDLRQPTALLFGAEGPGLSGEALAAADVAVSIPMRAPVESLNVAVAVALLTCEASRQRGLF
jgi:RNA methyltransferase, TrmH family